MGNEVAPPRPTPLAVGDEPNDAEAIAALDAYSAEKIGIWSIPAQEHMRAALDAAAAWRKSFIDTIFREYEQPQEIEIPCRAQPASGLAEDVAKIVEAFDDPWTKEGREAITLAESLPGKIEALELSRDRAQASMAESMRQMNAKATDLYDARKKIEALEMERGKVSYLNGVLCSRDQWIRDEIARTEAAESQLATAIKERENWKFLYDRRLKETSDADQKLEALGFPDECNGRDLDLSERIDLMQSQLTARDADAVRYRWLRTRDLDTIEKGGIFAGMTPKNVVLNLGDLDRAIDEAIAGPVAEKEK